MRTDNVTIIPPSSYSKMDTVEQIVSDYIQPVICVFGILCNVINMLVLTRPQMKESPYSYLLGLASMDLSVLVMLFIRGVISAKLGKGLYGWTIFDGFIFLPIANMFSNAGVWVTVFLTFERWVSVTFPLKAKEVCTKGNARKVMLTVILLSVLINIPRFFCRKVIKITTDTGIRYTSVSSKFEQSEMYRGITWLYIVLIHFIPCITLIGLNVFLLRAVRKANLDRRGLHEVNDNNNIAVHISREQRRLTATCVSIICLFLVCVIPTALSNPPVAYALFGGDKEPEIFFRQLQYRQLRIVTNMLFSFNLSMNFVLYCLFNHKFLKTLNHLCKTYIYRIFKVEISETAFRRMSNSSNSGRPQWSGRAGNCEALPCLELYGVGTQKMKSTENCVNTRTA